jgi:integrase
MRFLEDNDKKLSKNFVKNLYGRGDGSAIQEEYIPTAEDIRRLLDYVPIHIIALILVMCSSGIRPEEALNLHTDDFDFTHEPPRINIRWSVAKNDKARITFITSEALEAIFEWLKYRDQFLERNKNKNRKHQKDLNCLSCFTYSNFNKIWENALRKIGLDQKVPVTHRLILRARIGHSIGIGYHEHSFLGSLWRLGAEGGNVLRS